MKEKNPMDMGGPKMPEQESDVGTEKAVEIWKKMQKILPENAGFMIEPNRLSREENRREEILKLFEDEELIGFIQNNPELVKKILTLQRLLAERNY